HDQASETRDGIDHRDDAVNVGVNFGRSERGNPRAPSLIVNVRDVLEKQRGSGGEWAERIAEDVQIAHVGIEFTRASLDAAEPVRIAGADGVVARLGRLDGDVAVVLREL